MDRHIRGIEHVGVTVPDMKQAEDFFHAAFGATVMYRTLEKQEGNVPGYKVGPVNSLPTDDEIRAISMLRLGNGANIELFEMLMPTRDKAPIITDMGVTHFSIYVDDLEAIAGRAREAGATLMEGPADTFAQEGGEGNRNWFLKTPWGSLVELITLPSPMTYDSEESPQRVLPIPL
ncbi:VOC family protein [Salinicola rhizosphaerae]|uniref:Glyoxalase n=1 Tax=Salinicola rhizosphaerae TaxID=1443141 RepID=A0ABQ3E6V1_9GAMM|nr:VOC family protein [Salinicola rhizosphaerae]GHB22973.1 glyoxalase [Salinicola rhizosphaerae]